MQPHRRRGIEIGGVALRLYAPDLQFRLASDLPRRTFCMEVLRLRVCSGVRSFRANVMPDAGNVLIVGRDRDLNLKILEEIIYKRDS